MKKRIFELIAFTVLLLLCTSAAGEALTQSITDDDLVFIFDDVEYKMGMPSKPLVSAIEKQYNSPMEMLSVQSCMFDGMDKEFSNDDIVIGTYPINDDQLESVLVFSEKYKTARGAYVGMSLSQITELYGDSYVLDYDQMIYTSPGGGNIIFTIDVETKAVMCWTIILGTMG